MTVYCAFIPPPAGASVPRCQRLTRLDSAAGWPFRRWYEAIDGLRAWLKDQYQWEIDRGDPRARFENDDAAKVARLEATSPHLEQCRWMLEVLDTAAVVHVADQRIRKYPPTAAVGWLWTYHGGVAVAADGTVAPSPAAVDVYP